MAIVHRAELRPSKLELLAAWLPTQGWFAADGDIERVSAFRFDDPAGEVGIETFIIGCAGRLFHVPLTYRAEPLEGGLLAGTLDHSVLGTRYVYDAESDPVYRSVVTSVIANAETDVDMVLDDGTPVPRLEWWATASGSGASGDVSGMRLAVARELPASASDGAPVLVASWTGHDEPLVVAWLTTGTEQ